MPDFVTFTLTGPMGAFGDLAGHERRGTALWPARSAIIGLLGAAQGVSKDDAAGQAKLDGWRMAVSVLAEGAPLRDYHTVQTVPGKVKRPNSRREALAAAGGSVNTIITQRDYRSDVCFGVALWPADPAAPPAPPADLVAALDRPVFVPYLGRKSCPLSAPLAARIVQAPDPLAALGALTLPPWLAAAQAGRHPDPARPILVAADPFEGLEPDRVETRWDQPTDRAAWHFAQREVHVHTPGEA